MTTILFVLLGISYWRYSHVRALMSTSSGSHINVFSYYALLNAGIFMIAWFKTWRVI